jgi:hypothetical protein
MRLLVGYLHRSTIAAIIVLGLAPSGLMGQGCSAFLSPLASSLPPSACRPVSAPLGPAPPTTSSGKAFVLSALLPGAGQYAQGQRRWIAYAGAEVAAWIYWGRARSRASGFRSDYRDLAWGAARTFVGERRDGDWEYYERVSKFTRSGAYDSDPARAGVQPEADVTTFNGDAWRLARQINFAPGTDPQPGDPDYDAALQFYLGRAAGVEFEWDWTGRDAERAKFKGLIEESDSAFKDASLLGGAIVFNHVLSALDGFLSSRVSALTDRPMRFRMGWVPSFQRQPSTFSWSTEWRVR